MKKTVVSIMLIMLLFSLFGCGNKDGLVGSKSKVTGSIITFVSEDGENIESFWSQAVGEKSVTLERSRVYTIKLRPSFTGSQYVSYIGDCAEFTYEEESCTIAFVSDAEKAPVYEITANDTVDFDLTIKVGGYTQTIKICVD